MENYYYFLISGMSWLKGNAESLPLEDSVFDAYTIAFGIRNCTHIDRVFTSIFILRLYLYLFFSLSVYSHLFLALVCIYIQGSKLGVVHGNQNVTWATWKRRKIAQLAINNSSSPVSLNYRLSVCIVIVFLLPVQLKCFELKRTSVMAFQTGNQNA